MTRRPALFGKLTFTALALACSACTSHPSTTEGAQTPLASTSASPSPALATPPASAVGAAGASALPPPSASSSAAPPSASAAPPSASSSAAPTTGKMCGGIAGIRCAEKQYCSFPPESKCGAGDMAGECKPVPELCTMEYAPVCGCDGKTYGSKCVAARAAVSVAKAGACPKP